MHCNALHKDYNYVAHLHIGTAAIALGRTQTVISPRTTAAAARLSEDHAIKAGTVATMLKFWEETNYWKIHAHLVVIQRDM